MTKWIKVFDSLTAAEEKLGLYRSLRLRIGQTKVCLTRTQEGFFAVDDACPHQGESLSKGTVNIHGEVICPWHSYRYDVRFGRECAQRTPAVRTYPIRSDENGFFLGLEVET